MADINVNAGKVPVWYYAAGAAGLYVAYTVYKRVSGGSKTSVSTTTPAGSSSTPVVAAASYGQDYSGELANINQQLQALQKPQTTSPSTTTTAGAIIATAANQVLSGAGYQPDAKQPQKQFTPISSNNHVYLVVPDLLQAATVGGANLYYEPNPGQFSLIPGASVNNLAAGTPFYRQVI